MVLLINRFLIRRWHHTHYGRLVNVGNTTITSLNLNPIPPWFHQYPT